MKIIRFRCGSYFSTKILSTPENKGGSKLREKSSRYVAGFCLGLLAGVEYKLYNIDREQASPTMSSF